MVSEAQVFPRKVAVLGAGTIGSQIAALLANAGIEVLLFDLPGQEADPSAPVRGALERLRAIQPSPLAAPRVAQSILAVNYAEHLDRLPTCDLVVEAINEGIDDKEGFYARIGPYIPAHGSFATSTPGLDIGRLARALPESCRSRFCGVQFFAPIRQRRLVELVAASTTDPVWLDSLETFLVTHLGRQVIRAKDTPNFIANRIGLFALLIAIHHAERFGLDPDTVDLLMVHAFDLDSLAIFGTVDAMGIDALGTVLANASVALPEDRWLCSLSLPEWLQSLVAQGCLGDKSAGGVYRRVGGTRQVHYAAGDCYRPCESALKGVHQSLGHDDPTERMLQLRASGHPHAQFLWSVLRDVCYYAALRLETIAESAHEVDEAMHWGFGWRRGVFELWQSIGWRRIAEWITQDIGEGKLPAGASSALPAWIGRVAAPYNAKGSYAPASRTFVRGSRLPVYARQLLAPRGGGRSNQLGRSVADKTTAQLLSDVKDNAVLQFKADASTVDTGRFLAELGELVAIAGNGFRALLIVFAESVGLPGPPRQLIAANGSSGSAPLLAGWQELHLQLRYGPVPVIAAIDGDAHGSALELAWYCNRVVASLDSTFCFPDLATGRLPATGGLTELARRASEQAGEYDLLPALQSYYQWLTNGSRTASALHARHLGLLQHGDCIVMHPGELLFVAKAQALAMAECAFRPPARAPVVVAGESAASALLSTTTASRVDRALAKVLCGGDVEAGTAVGLDSLLALEREVYAELAVGE